MDITKEQNNPNPMEKANPLSVLFFGYTIDMFKKGYRKVLEPDDLYNPLNADKSSHLGDRLEKNWTKETNYATKRKSNASLGKVLVKTFWPEYLLLAILLSFMDLILRLIQPLMLGKLLEYFRPGSDMPKEDALWYAAAVVGVNAGSALMINQYIFRAFHYGMRVRAACCSLIYRKALKLSRTALGETASGKVVNLLSNDVSRFDVVSILIHHMWVAPLSSCIVTYFLWSEAGLAGIIGILPVLLVVPLQVHTGKLSSKYRRRTAYKTDERVRLMDEIISGIQVIKMYAWEKPFEKLIQNSRVKELKEVTKISYLRGLYMTFNLFTTRVALFCSLITLVLSDKPITATTVFVFMSYFNILSQTMTSMFVRGISEIAELFVSIKRIQEFLMNDEFSDTSRNSNNNDAQSQADVAVAMNCVTAKWDATKTESALKKVNLNVQQGKLLGVIGPVGSGKSSLLQTILGELDVESGDVIINGKLSYAAQEPWVFAATIRQNITFGLSYDKRRYQEVVKACALEKDFKQFDNGDMTIVGDRGASLSGGQKARINLARAVYRDSDIYLLDDPLSAVDIHVAKHLYQHCLNGFLKNKTRILVTHQVHHLKDADHIVIFNEGEIETEGNFSNLANNTDIKYAKLLKEEPESNDDELSKSIEKAKVSRQISTRSKTASMSSAHSETSLVDSLYEEPNDEDNDSRSRDMLEDSSRGKIKGSLFLKYIMAGGNCFFVMVVISLYVLAQTAASSVDYFVSYWTNIEEFRYANLTNSDGELKEFLETDTYLYIYAGLIVALFLLALIRSLLFYKLVMKSSQKLHDSMFKSIVSTTMHFFDTNPSGRILNRFSKDIGAIDELLPKAILDASQIILLLIGSLILVAMVNPLFLVPVAVIASIFLMLRVIFLKSSKNIKRLEGMMRSPVFTHLNASIQGLTTIRAYGAEDTLKLEFDKHQDLHTSAWFMYIAASSAFGFYLDILCFIFTALVTFSFLTFGDAMSGGDVGLAITQASALTGIVQWGMRQSAEVANQLMSVERVMEYNMLEEEKQPFTPKKPHIEWPSKGKIIFKGMGLRYSPEMPLVLRDLNITIEPKEKVGIVGRTGAGKSSLIVALFRLGFIEGEIEIDDIDTDSITLQLLRSQISIIPQDPVLFSGTLRYNLDPFEEYNDDVLWKALEYVELKDTANIINRLENRVMDRGSNYSVGQRQLICLARAIVRNNKILLLDEATANVDPQTDALIQKTIRQKFADCTVLTIAHRLDTIMDSDKVVVMESGTIVEYNHPHELLSNRHSKFYKMVKSTGKTMSEQLKKIARQSYHRKNEVQE
ncbi:PREDICTED: multidrug resistance-associated protein 4-like [Nicrophorus vespilloides]|uniref:Multidrug resistance-associated protein 4-like n=1 Tax=Nicrophorus vespilloides TaxID=110193 RepID=A0ABM1M2R2_NICVS|nr:PREDICTED: multidrug resistance-associated protein 4-like [Nicrophorus vespilloides]XP_017768862.1 PREDICTED: multidrug resistance-associated protein 4-like [Nicrophorus vespilloides]